MFTTVWRNNKGTEITAAREMDLVEIERVMRACPSAQSKDALPLMKCARFGDRRTVKKSLRHDANVLAVSGVEGDYDGEEMSMQLAAEALSNAGVAALLCTTASHKPDAPRWHVFVPLSAELEGTPEELKEQRAHWVGVLNARLGGVLNAESFTLSQSYYFGNIVGNGELEIIRLAGVCLDQLPAPAPVLREAKTAQSEADSSGDHIPATLEGISTGEHIFQVVRDYSARLIAKGISHVEALELLRGYLLGHKRQWESDPEQLARWQEVWDKLPGMLEGAVGKYAPTQSCPEPLRRPLPPAEPYPMEALGRVLGPAAQRVHEVVLAPPALCGLSFLAAASVAAQAHADVSIDGRIELLSLSVVTIGLSGERKGAVDRAALREHRAREHEDLVEYRLARRKFEQQLVVYEALKRAAVKVKKGSTRGSIEGALADLGPPPVPPVNPVLLTSNPTLEGLHKLYAGRQPAVGLFNDDAGEFIGGSAMNDDNKLKTAAGLSRLYDAGEFDRVRAGDGAGKFYGRRLALHLMIQPIVAQRVLSDEILIGQGLLARTLFAWPASTIGDRPYVAADLSRDSAIIEYRKAMRALLDRPERFRDGTDDELDPPTLTLEPDAKATWIEIHDAIEADQKDGGAWASVRAWASKAASVVLRIAGVLTLVESPGAVQINTDAIRRAALLVNFHLGEAVRIVGTASVPANIQHAEALLDWCHRNRLRRLHSSAALQYGPNPVRTVEMFDEAIAVLERTGWATRIEGGCEVDGKHRRRVWDIARAQP